MNSGRLFHREEMQEQKAFAPALILTPGTARVIPLCDINEWNGSDVASTVSI